MDPASNNPGGQPPLPPSNVNPKDTKSGGGRKKNNTKSRHNSAAFPSRERGDQSCYALNCSTPIPTYAIRNEHSRSRVNDPDHLAEYIYCWAPYTDKNGNLQNCNYSRRADRTDEINSHLREGVHAGKFSAEQKEGWRFLTLNINHNARLHLGRLSNPSTAVLPPGFQMTQEAQYYLDLSVRLRQNPVAPQFQQGLGRGLLPVPAPGQAVIFTPAPPGPSSSNVPNPFYPPAPVQAPALHTQVPVQAPAPAAPPAAGPALANVPIDPGLQYQGPTAIHHGHAHGQAQGYSASVGQQQGYGYGVGVGQGQQHGAGPGADPYAAYSLAPPGNNQSNDNTNELGDIYSSNDLDNAPSATGTVAGGQAMPTNTLSNTSWRSPDEPQRFQQPQPYDPNGLWDDYLNPESLQRGPGPSFSGQRPMPGQTAPSLSPSVQARGQGSGASNDNYRYPSPPQLPSSGTFTGSPADGPSRAAHQTVEQTTPTRGPANRTQHRGGRGGQGSPRGGNQGYSAGRGY